VGQDENDDEGPFVPLRLLYGRGAVNDRKQDRERRIAEHLDRHRVRGRQPGGRGRGLSRADIVATAIAIADAEGTEAVSIRRIARELRAGPMSLYWHVSSKEELHVLMLEQVQAEVEAAEPSGDWRADLRAFAVSTRAALLRHPWAADFLGSGPPTGPNDARNLERLLGALDAFGLDPAAKIWSLMTVGTYVLGAVLREIQQNRWHRAVADPATGLSEAEIAEHVGEFERKIQESGAYPHIAQLLKIGFDPDSPDTKDERFEFGLSCVLDGIAVRIGQDSG
jgi:AcrR family transcriptional regulator